MIILGLIFSTALIGMAINGSKVHSQNLIQIKGSDSELNLVQRLDLG